MALLTGTSFYNRAGTVHDWERVFKTDNLYRSLCGRLHETREKLDITREGPRCKACQKLAPIGLVDSTSDRGGK